MCSGRLFSFAFTITVYFQKLLKLLELVGLNGSTEVGLAALARGDELNGLRSPFCAQAILVYHTAFKFNLDPYNIDLDEVRSSYCRSNEIFFFRRTNNRGVFLPKGFNNQSKSTKSRHFCKTNI